MEPAGKINKIAIKMPNIFFVLFPHSLVVWQNNSDDKCKAASYFISNSTPLNSEYSDNTNGSFSLFLLLSNFPPKNSCLFRKPYKKTLPSRVSITGRKCYSMHFSCFLRFVGQFLFPIDDVRIESFRSGR